MPDATIVRENDDARKELAELAGGLREHDFTRRIGENRTVAGVLCHLAFWDQRALYLLKQWQANAKVETSRLDRQSVDSINEAVNRLALEVPGPAAVRLARDSAAAVDACVAEIGDELAAVIQAAGFDRYLRRSLHRREHLGRIREALSESV